MLKQKCVTPTLNQVLLFNIICFVCCLNALCLLGKPSYVLMHEDVDWAPNKQLGSVGEQVVNRKKRHAIISSKRMAQPIIKPSKKKRTPSM